MPRTQSYYAPPTWSKVMTDQVYNDWQLYIHGKTANSFKKAPSAGERLLKQAKQLLHISK